MATSVDGALPNKRIKSLAEYVSYVEKQQESTHARLWFRGVGNVSYPLICSLYRHPKQRASADLLRLERNLLVAFEERCLPFVHSDLREEWGKLFFMQHQGIPTRLLDWTENPFVALYFAVEAAHSSRLKNGTYQFECSVWILDPGNWNKSVFGPNLDETVLSTSSDRLTSYKPSRQHSEIGPFAAAISGFHNSARIVSQRGKFTIFGRDVQGMDSMVPSLPYLKKTNPPLRKILIGKDAIGTIRTSLFNYGITESVIYPDLEGLSRELRREFGFGE